MDIDLNIPFPNTAVEKSIAPEAQDAPIETPYAPLLKVDKEENTETSQEPVSSVEEDSVEPSWTNRLNNLMAREGNAFSLSKEIEVADISKIPMTGPKDTRIKGTSNYGLYYDHEGRLSGGVGHLVKSSDNIAALYSMDKKTAKELLDKDVEVHDLETLKLLKKEGIPLDSLDKLQIDAFKDFVFQLGATRSHKFTESWKKLREAVRSQKPEDMLEAVKEFENSDWAERHGDRAKDFRERMLKGQPQSSSNSPEILNLNEFGTYALEQSLKEGVDLPDLRKEIELIKDVSERRPASMKKDDPNDLVDSIMLEGIADYGGREIARDSNLLEDLSDTSLEGMGNDFVNKLTDNNIVGRLTEAAIDTFLQDSTIDPSFNIKEQDAELYQEMTEGLPIEDIEDVLGRSFNRADFIKNASLKLAYRQRQNEVMKYASEHPVLSGVNLAGSMIVEAGAFMPLSSLATAATTATRIKRVSDLARSSRIGGYLAGEVIEGGVQEVLWSKFGRDYEFDTGMFLAGVGLGVGLKTSVAKAESNKLVRDFLNDEGGFINLRSKEGKKLVDEVSSRVSDKQAVAFAEKISEEKTLLGNNIRKSLMAQLKGRETKIANLKQKIKVSEYPEDIKMLKGQLQNQQRKLDRFTKKLPKELESILDGTHPKLSVDLNPNLSIKKIASELGIPKDKVSTIKKTREFLGFDRGEWTTDFKLEGEEAWHSVMYNNLEEMRNNKRLNMNEILKDMANSSTVKNLDELPILNKLQIGNKLHSLASTDGPVSRLLFNKANLVSSENPEIASFYNMVAGDGMGRSKGSKIRGMESQQKYADIYGGRLTEVYLDTGDKLYEIVHGKSLANKVKGFISPDSFEDTVMPIISERLFGNNPVAFRAKHGDEIADLMDDFTKKWQKVDEDMLERAREVGVEGLDFDPKSVYAKVSWDGRKTRAVNESDLKDAVYQSMINNAKRLGIEEIDLDEIRKAASKFTYGIRNFDITHIEDATDANIAMFSKMLAKAEGQELTVISDKLESLKRLKAKADAGDLANKTQLDLDVELPDGRKLHELFEDNIVAVQKRHLGRMSARIAAAEQGIKNINDLDKWVESAYKREVKRLAKKGVKDPVATAKHAKDSMEQDLASFKNGGLVGLNSPTDNKASDFIRLVKKYNFARLMQYTGISSIPEFGGTIAEAGIKNTLRASGQVMADFINTVYHRDPEKFVPRMYDELKTITGVGIGDFAFSSKGFAKATRITDEGSGLLNQAEKLIDSTGRVTQKTFGFIENSLRKATVNALAIQWGNHFNDIKEDGLLSAFFGKNGVSNRVLENSNLGIINEAGEFVANDNYKRIKKAMRDHAKFDEYGRLEYLNLDKWDSEVAHSFGDVLKMQSGHIMVDPDAATMAHWQSTGAGQIMNQFRSFTINATTKVMGATLANAAISAHRGDTTEVIKTGQKLFWGTMLGTLSVAVRQGIQRAGGDDEVDLFDEGMIRAFATGLARSSVVGNLPMLTDTTMNFFGFDPLFERTSSTGRSQSIFNLETSPTGQAVKGTVEGVKKAAQGDLSGAGEQLFKISPFKRQMGVQQLYNALQRD